MQKKLLILITMIISACGNAEMKETEKILNEAGQLNMEQEQLIHQKAKLLPNQAQIAVALIEKGVVKFYGVERAADTTLTIDNHDRVFEIGSITKVFTGTLLAQAVVEHKLTLDQEIGEVLGFALKDQAQITLQQLATHTSGLPRIPADLDSVSLDNPYQMYGAEQLREYLTERLQLIHHPGETWAYSNLGGGLLGYVLREAENSSYEGLLQAKIFERYGMEHSTTQRAKVADRLVRGVDDRGEEVSNWDFLALAGAGGILSTTADLAKFALAQLDDTNETLALTRTSFFKVTESFSMGLGWSLITTETGATWYWHNGGTGGYTSVMILDTEAKNGVIILANISALGELTQEVAGLGPALMETLREE